jgi:hypothetical protein
LIVGIFGIIIVIIRSGAELFQPFVISRQKFFRNPKTLYQTIC